MLTSPQYAPYIIWDYFFWTLFLNTKQQPYVGRCYAWWKDRTPNEGEGMRLADLDTDAFEELQLIEDHVMTAYGALGHLTEPYAQNFLLNASYLANEGHLHNHHFHIHFVPRFRQPLMLSPIGLEVKDELWGRNYANPPGGEKELSEIKLQYIRLVMADAIKAVVH